MEYVIGAVVGLVIGGALAWLIASGRAAAAGGTIGELRARADRAEAASEALRAELHAAGQARVRAETELAEARKSIEEQRKLLDEARTKLADTFKALSSDALRTNSEAFAQRADELMKPLRERLKEYEEHVREIEKTRREAYGGLNEQLKALAQTHQRLEKETHSLSAAMRNPQARGAWGEMVLRRVVELAGMTRYCDFAEQVTAETGAGRPDMVVNLPGGRRVIVDSKAPTEDYRQAVTAESEEQRQAMLARHARRIRDHMTALSRKAYWEQFADAAEFVVMFIPGESFFSGAVDQDATLIEDGMRNRIVLATPTTLIALLWAVAYGWRQEDLARNAQAVSDLGKDLYERLCTWAGHLERLGKALGGATDAYNQAVGSLESRVLPAARRLPALGVPGTGEIPVLNPVEGPSRTLSAPDVIRDDGPADGGNA